MPKKPTPKKGSHPGMSKAIYKVITEDIASDWTDESIKAKF